ncbi:16S rRNA (guanine(527)-N(7))-methyltransferase RsmG [Botrimarina colliarenosi]|uniref:16S rRNA (guanine(527)-N(7))-methyltransferase RsmG n=1 Tax=Botrimarina colliarenosi TaxID=2528001 RepID=UPI0018D2F9B4|nr:16S rRNA (guanine(527)-N(7))-methyltransferase RsmG [Botrimarina colliarenosi]
MTTPEEPTADTPADGPLSDGPLADAPLAEVAASCGLELTPAQVTRLDAYRKLLWSWNEKLNLTRHTTMEKFVTRDLFDTIQLSALIPEGETVLDVGSGGGVPGIPLAILRPDLTVRLCESVNKKANVLFDIVEQLGLNVTVYAARVEAVVERGSQAPRFDTLIARGVAPLWKFMFWLRPHHERWGRLLLIKGPSWVDERAEARHRGLMKGFELRRLAEYEGPRNAAITTLLTVTRAEAPAAGKRGKKR